MVFGFWDGIQPGQVADVLTIEKDVRLLGQLPLLIPDELLKDGVSAGDLLEKNPHGCRWINLDFQHFRPGCLPKGSV